MVSWLVLIAFCTLPLIWCGKQSITAAHIWRAKLSRIRPRRGYNSSHFARWSLFNSTWLTVSRTQLVSHNYWNNLHELRVYSQEWRREINMVIFLMKISQVMADGYDVQVASDGTTYLSLNEVYFILSHIFRSFGVWKRPIWKKFGNSGAEKAISWGFLAIFCLDYPGLLNIIDLQLSIKDGFHR